MQLACSLRACASVLGKVDSLCKALQEVRMVAVRAGLNSGQQQLCRIGGWSVLLYAGVLGQAAS